MLTYVTINLFKSPAQTLVNTVNTVGVMGKGIAKTFKQLYPEMYQEYRQLCQDKKIAIGKLYIYRTPNKIVVNFPTKKHWRNRSKVEYIEAGLEEFVNVHGEYGISSVSFPQLGCGNGELDWEQQVKPVMEHYLKNLPIPVYIHLYPESPDFVPERLDAKYVRQIQMERQILPFNQVWQDLQSLIHHSAQQLPLFASDTVQAITIAEDYIQFQRDSGDTLIVYRQDMAGLWSTLRLNGTLNIENVPEPIRADGATLLVFALLVQLPYVQYIDLQPFKHDKPTQGLQYMPPPQTEVEQAMEIVV
jgi:O-acetyl-ADP-ribose deacetylase (regulator of RNase III)